MLTFNRVSGQNSDVLTLALYPYVPDKDPIYRELKSFVSSPDNHIFSVRNEDLVTLYDTSLITSLLTEN